MLINSFSILFLSLNLYIMSNRFLNRTSFGDPKNAGNLMPVDEAHSLLNEWVPNEKLRLHMKQVAANMKAWAIEKENADEQTAMKMGTGRFVT